MLNGDEPGSIEGNQLEEPNCDDVEEVIVPNGSRGEPNCDDVGGAPAEENRSPGESYSDGRLYGEDECEPNSVVEGEDVVPSDGEYNQGWVAGLARD